MGRGGGITLRRLAVSALGLAQDNQRKSRDRTSEVNLYGMERPLDPFLIFSLPECEFPIGKPLNDFMTGWYNPLPIGQVAPNSAGSA